MVAKHPEPEDWYAPPYWGYFQTRTADGGYALYRMGRPSPIAESASPFFKPGVDLILSELAKPAAERNLDALDAGIAMLDPAVLAAVRRQLSAGRSGVARHLLAAHDPRLGNVVGEMLGALVARLLQFPSDGISTSTSLDEEVPASRSESPARSRKLIVNRHMAKKSEFRNRDVVVAMCQELDQEGIPLPKRRTLGRTGKAKVRERKGTYSAAFGTRAWSGIAGVLKRDLYPRKRKP